MLSACPKLYYTNTHWLFGGWKLVRFKLAKLMSWLKHFKPDKALSHSCNMRKIALEHDLETNTAVGFVSCHISLSTMPLMILHLWQCFILRNTSNKKVCFYFHKVHMYCVWKIQHCGWPYSSADHMHQQCQA